MLVELYWNAAERSRSKIPNGGQILEELTDYRTGSGSDRILALTEARGISY
jgi:hypothetical protein